MDVVNDVETSGHARQSSASGKQRSTETTPSQIGRKRASNFLRDVFEAPPKSRRLEIANEIKALEVQYDRTVNRIKKTKHQLRGLASRLKDDETQRAQLDERLHLLKSELTTDE